MEESDDELEVIATVLLAKSADKKADDEQLSRDSSNDGPPPSKKAAVEKSEDVALLDGPLVISLVALLSSNEPTAVDSLKTLVAKTKAVYVEKGVGQLHWRYNDSQVCAPASKHSVERVAAPRNRQQPANVRQAVATVAGPSAASGAAPQPDSDRPKTTKTCSVCRRGSLPSTDASSQLLDCSSCDRAIHAKCATPPVTREQADDPRFLVRCSACAAQSAVDVIVVPTALDSSSLDRPSSLSAKPKLTDSSDATNSLSATFQAYKQKKERLQSKVGGGGGGSATSGSGGGGGI